MLNSITIYLLSMMNPPKKVLVQIDKIFVSFFWSKVGLERDKHLVKWEDLCYQFLKGGLGFKSLFDISKALFAKHWWKFKTSKDSL